VPQMLEEAGKKFAQVKEAAGLDHGGSQDVDFFSMMAARYRPLRAAWDALTTAGELDLAASMDVFGGLFSIDFFDTWSG
jgi:hypothetical protein